MNQLVVMVCMHARVCAHMCVHYEADTSIIYSSALSARLPHCVFQHASQSLCHMHYLTHTRTPALMQIATRAIYLGYAHLSPCLLLAPTVANDCTSPSSTHTFVGSSSGHTHTHHTCTAFMRLSFIDFCFHIMCTHSPTREVLPPRHVVSVYVDM